MLWVQKYLEELHPGNDVPMWVKFIDRVRIAIGRLVFDIDFGVYVVLKKIFSCKIWVEIYGYTH